MPKKGYRTESSTETEVKVGAYVRVSTDEQRESGLGMDAQRLRCSAMCQVKGWPVPVFYEDDGISGTKPVGKRPGLHSLVEDIKAGKITAVIIPSLDRLARKTYIIINLMEEFRLLGIPLISCKETFDTSTPQGQLVLVIFAALAQFERDQTAERTEAALAVRGRRDGEMGGRLPYGYRRVFQMVADKRVCTGVEVDTDAAKVVRRIFALRKKAMTFREISAAISTAERRWSHSSIPEILKNEDAYRGGQRGESELHWPSILR